MLNLRAYLLVNGLLIFLIVKDSPHLPVAVTCPEGDCYFHLRLTHIRPGYNCYDGYFTLSSYFVLSCFCSGVPGKSACLLDLAETVSFPSALFLMGEFSFSSKLSTISSQVPSNTSLLTLNIRCCCRNFRIILQSYRWNAEELANCPLIWGAVTKLKIVLWINVIFDPFPHLALPKVVTILTVVFMTVLGSCSSPYILLSRALLSSMNVVIDPCG